MIDIRRQRLNGQRRSSDRPGAPMDAVIFDWGGTLTPWHAVDLEEQWRVYARVAHPDRVEEVVRAIVTAEQDAWSAARTTGRSSSLEAIFSATELEMHEPALAAYHAFWEPHTYIDPDAPELFRALRDRGSKVGVLSNTIWPREYHEAVFARDGVLDLIDGAVYTSEILWTKPHREAFLAALTAVGVSDPAHAVFVGDRLFDDIYGAQAVGMRAIFVPHSEIPPDQLGHVEGKPDAVVQRLADVLTVIDEWRSSERLTP
jgi:putative hydrolase of the HAD superfamily